MRRLRFISIALLLLVPGLSTAKKRVKERYFVKLLETQAGTGTGTPFGLPAKAETALRALMAETPLFVPDLKGAPDPAKNPAGYKTYLAKKKLRAFTLRVKIITYHRVTAPAKTGKSGQLLKVTIGLALLGASIPDATLAMAGNGTATVGLEVGKNVRPRDEAYCAEEALKSALKTALDDALFKLRTVSRSRPAKK